jgi:hypothetical protein
MANQWASKIQSNNAGKDEKAVSQVSTCGRSSCVWELFRPCMDSQTSISNSLVRQTAILGQVWHHGTLRHCQGLTLDVRELQLRRGRPSSLGDSDPSKQVPYMNEGPILAVLAGGGKRRRKSLACQRHGSCVGTFN